MSHNCVIIQRALFRGLNRARVGPSTQLRLQSRSSNVSLSDPYPLPLSNDVLPGNSSTFDVLDTSLLPPPIARPNESLSSLRARLVYQTRKRGTLESDLLLSTFAKEHLPVMSEVELREFDKVRLYRLV